MAEWRARTQRFQTRSFLIMAVSGSALGIGAGVWMSRRMTAPLGELTNGAQVIGARNLNVRIVECGSYEVVTVARAFNQMAADLQEAEQSRQNLLADVAHELRTPLTVLQGNLRAILDDVYALDKAEVAHLYDQTRHLIALVNELHELVQAEAQQLSLHREKTNLAELADSCVTMLEPLAEAAGVDLHVNLPSKPVLTHIDRARMTQVLQNLLTNALSHTPPDGTIRVQVAQDGDAAILSIHDTGEGIDPDHLLRVFDRFYRTDPARTRESGGVGLGLAIVRALVEAHGGNVTVESDGRNRGSTFTVRLPRG